MSAINVSSKLISSREGGSKTIAPPIFYTLLEQL